MPNPAYISEYPSSTPLDPAYKTFFQDFYAASDDPSAHKAYAQFFTQDAVLIMASRRAEGRDAILQLRTSMWETVASRTHTPRKVFPFGSGSNEVMLYGTVRYGLKDGAQSMVDWAARAVLCKEKDEEDEEDEEDGGRVRMRFYQVYLDTGAQAK